MFTTLFLLLAAAATTRADAFFMVMQPRLTAMTTHRHQSTTTKTTTDIEPLSDMDEMCLENMAILCEQVLDCSLDEHEALVNRVHAQRDYHQQHAIHLSTLLRQLQGQCDYTNQVVRGENPESIASLRVSIQRDLHMLDLDNHLTPPPLKKDL